jgi:single-strand DNA-binding protein
LKLDQWADKQTGDKRSKLRIVVDNVQFLEPRRDGQGSASPRRQESTPPSQDAPPSDDYGPGSDAPMDAPPPAQGDKDIPF